MWSRKTPAMIWTVTQVAIGGAIGAVARFGVVSLSARAFGPSLPWGTLAVNVFGSFLMGVLVVGLAAKSGMRLSPLLLTGLLGGFTTFSAFSLDFVNLWERGAQGAAVAYASGSVVFSIAALALGVMLARGMWL